MERDIWFLSESLAYFFLLSTKHEEHWIMCSVRGFFLLTMNIYLFLKALGYIHTPTQEIKRWWTRIEGFLENISYFRGVESMSLKIMVSASMNAHLVFSKLNFLLPGSPGQIYCPWPKKGFFFFYPMKLVLAWSKVQIIFTKIIKKL